jgi:hypothetical protein
MEPLPDTVCTPQHPCVARICVWPPSTAASTQHCLHRTCHIITSWFDYYFDFLSPTDRKVNLLLLSLIGAQQTCFGWRTRVAAVSPPPFILPYPSGTRSQCHHHRSFCPTLEALVCGKLITGVVDAILHHQTGNLLNGVPRAPTKRRANNCAIKKSSNPYVLPVFACTGYQSLHKRGPWWYWFPIMQGLCYTKPR